MLYLGENMNKKDIVKRQFDLQAKKFSNWSVTKNEEYMQAYFKFFGLEKNDNLLDVACGTGEFSVFCARRIKNVHGIDISQGAIDLAYEQVSSNSCLDNVTFECHDVEKIPCATNSFSAVSCGSAFHHMENYLQVFGEMLRCCKSGGKIALQDIVAYDDMKVNSFFEMLEKNIDISHNATLNKQDFIDLFKQSQVDVIRSFVVEIELNFDEYINHAFQSSSNLKKIKDLLDQGRQDEKISSFLFHDKKGELVLKRSIFLILGCKS
jgi:ubiquinone/menaquinone biosynthesis C-methylase UbiE